MLAVCLSACGGSESDPARGNPGAVPPAKSQESAESSEPLIYVGLKCEFSVTDRMALGISGSKREFQVSGHQSNLHEVNIELLTTPSGERVALHDLKLEWRADHGGQTRYRFEIGVYSREGKRISSHTENHDYPLGSGTVGGVSEGTTEPLGEQGTITLRTRCETIAAT